MGCGVSSGTQITPLDQQLPIAAQNSCPKTLLGKCSRPTSVNGFTRNNGFNLGLLFPCRFSGNESPQLQNLVYKQFLSSEVQTENDILGFKCQPSQTDSQILSDGELEAMIEMLEEEILKIQDECVKNKDTSDGEDGEEELNEEFMISQRTWKRIIKAHRDEIENGKRFANIAIQATRPKSTSATQTKFGSIDYQFVPKDRLESDLLADSADLLTKTISENLLKAIEEPAEACLEISPFNQHLSTLLTSFEDEDDDAVCPLPGSTTRMMDSLSKTFADYECHTGCKVASNGTVPNGHISGDEEPKPAKKTYDMRRKFLQQRLLKQQRFQDCLAGILDDIRSKKEQLIPAPVVTVKKRDVSLQTTNDILTDEAPEYAARPPLCHKAEIIPSMLMFREIDNRMHEAPHFETLQEFTQYTAKYAKNELFKIRAMFVWITGNIQYNFDQHNSNMISAEILQKREGVSKHYSQLFVDLCRVAGVRAKQIEGFVRGYDYRPGCHFQPGQNRLECWNAVFVLGSWRLLDLTLGAGFTNTAGEFQQKTNEFYFLTDPHLMFWTHYPYNELESDYQRWQLVDKPVKLEEFNSLPKVTEYFFDYNLSLRSRMENPLEFRISTEIKLGSHEAMRYKYKLYPAEEVENASLNHYVFCQLKEDRLVGSFMVNPPLEGRFLLKIFAKPEREMHGSQQDLAALLNPVLTMLLDCTKARKYIEPFPINELPWGPTQKFFDYKLKLINQKGPIIVTWGGRRRLALEANETMLITYSLFDSESMEMDARSVISRDDNGFKTTFAVNPPRVGTFKFMLFGMPKPKQKGKWRLPLLATFMIDCKLIKPLQHDEDQIHVPNGAANDSKDDKKAKGKK